MEYFGMMNLDIAKKSAQKDIKNESGTIFVIVIL
jgi:hypothetical protein